MSDNLRKRLSIRRSTFRDHPSWARILLESSDLLIIFLSLIAVAAVEQRGLDWSALQHLLRSNILLLTTAGLGFLLTADLLRLYRSWRWSAIRSQVMYLWCVWAIVALLLLLVAFNEDPGKSSRSESFFYWLLLTPVILTIWRVGIYRLVQRLRAVGINVRKVAVIGSNAEALDLAREIVARKDDSGVRFLGIFDNDNSAATDPEQTAEFRYRGGLSRAVEMAASRELDIIFIALPFHREQEIRELMDKLSDTTVSVQILIPELFEPVLYNQTREFGDRRTVSIYGTPFEDRLNARLKRFEDLMLSALLLPIALIPMILIALAVRVTSGSPVLFKQKRYGLAGKPVDVWKFRTMQVIESDDEISQAGRDDPRVTRIGAFLRRSSLDELPQLINVIQGQMSLVGPRPHPVNMNEVYRKLVKFYMLRHSVKPGITGWAQVNGWRGETEVLDKMEKRIEYDLFYIRNWSLFFDLKILILTVFHIIGGRNAY